MQNIQAIAQVLAQIQQRIDVALALVAKDSDNLHQYELKIKLREARAAMLRARNRIQTIMNNPKPPAITTPAQPLVDVTPGSKAGRRWAYCERCREYILRDQLSSHMWQLHRLDIDGRTKDLARVAAELQQRDNDLYRDD